MIEYPWIRISNLSQYLFTEIPLINPNSPRYVKWWREAKRICIEGMWGDEVGGSRYCPGRIPWYGSFCTITDTDEREKTRRNVRPNVSDLEWERAYMFLEAEGFSGFSEDDRYTSDIAIFDFKKNGTPVSGIDTTRFLSSNGKFKEYIEPRQLIRMLHDNPVGLPLYWNPSKNIIELGSRGGGKSYWYGLSGILYTITFLGVKYYTDKNRLSPPDGVGTLIGSGDSGKSGELISKVVDAMNAFATDQSLGVWGSLDSTDYTPCPFFREMSGLTNVNNKANPWRHEVQEKTTNGFIDKKYCYMNHVSYSNNREGGGQKAAGGRYNVAITEEIGLTENFIEALTSNEATVSTNGKQFGVQIGLGTAGNIKLIQQARRVMTNPMSYNMLAYDDVWENSGKIGFFLPAYMTLRQFKDSNGNTDIEKAKEFIASRRKEKENSDDPTILRTEKMNYPIIPSEMWVTDQSYILPYEESVVREKELIKNNLYKKIGTAVNLFWDSKEERGVGYELNLTDEPYYEFPIRENKEGVVVIYHHPERGVVIPNDMYIFGHDPYVAEEWEMGGSVGGTYVLLNPKYLPEGYKGDCLVATYIGKPKAGLERYYEIQEKLLAYYGNPIRGLWYEADRGEYCRGYYIRKKKIHLLCDRPQFEKGSSGRQSNIINKGYIVGNRVGKLSLLQMFRDWLLSPTQIGDETLLNIQRIPCIFLIRQIMQFDMDKGNYDAVMSMLGIALALKETEHTMSKNSSMKNKLASLNIFHKQGRYQQYNNALNRFKG